MSHFLPFLLLVCVVLPFCHGSEELAISNGNFEEWTADGKPVNWNSGLCIYTKDTDSHSGKYSAKITGRTRAFGPAPTVISVKRNTKYVFNAYIKYLNNVEGHSWDKIDCIIVINYKDGTSKRYRPRLPFLRATDGWQLLTGDFVLEDKEIGTGHKIMFNTDPTIEYLLDDVSLEEIVPNEKWRDAANQRIEMFRKTNITLKPHSETGDLSHYSLKVKLVDHDFPFGCAVGIPVWGKNEQYRKYFYDNFNSAVPENQLKWKMMEKNQGHIRWQPTYDVITKDLVAKGIRTRGHCLHWKNNAETMTWVKELSPANLKTAVTKRITEMMDKYKDILIAMDVNNEHCSGMWYEQHSGNINETKDMHRLARKLAPDVKLGINDYAVVRAPQNLACFIRMANVFKKEKVPLDYLGIESHLTAPLDLDVMNSRIDRVSDVELPIYITELDIANKDVDQRAQNYEDVVRLYFSKPRIQGIWIWGFWNKKHFRPDASFVEDDFTVNKAGLAWNRLVKDEWSTEESFTLKSDTQNVVFRGFYGKYQVEIYEGTKLIKTTNFNVPSNSSQPVEIAVTI